MLTGSRVSMDLEETSLCDLRSPVQPYLMKIARAVKKGFTSYCRPCLVQNALTRGATLW